MTYIYYFNLKLAQIFMFYQVQSFPSNDLSDCIGASLMPSHDDYEKTCNKCQHQQKHSTADLLDGSCLPDVLVIQINRVKWKNKLVKNRVKIDVPESLDMTKFCSDIQGKHADYSLCGLIEHCGDSCESGHYIAYARRNNCWYCFDDRKVVSCDSVVMKDVKTHNSNVYSLFYCKQPAEG